MSEFKSHDKLDILIRKIFKFTSFKDKQKIKKLMIETTSKNNIYEISQLASTAYKYNYDMNIFKGENRQDFIIEKIYNYMKELDFMKEIDPLISCQTRIADIGGGNGNILLGLNTKLKGLKENFICVETKTDWVEKYKFDNSSISYVFWDNNTIDIPDNSCHIVICMVSLHHMNDLTLDSVISQINRILVSNGILLIKEHDASDLNSCYLIEWEHYLYHILDCIHNNTDINLESYDANNILNMKSKECWQSLLERNNFNHIQRKNRFLDDEYVENDTKNPTNLYWDVFKKE